MLFKQSPLLNAALNIMLCSSNTTECNRLIHFIQTVSLTEYIPEHHGMQLKSNRLQSVKYFIQSPLRNTALNLLLCSSNQTDCNQLIYLIQSNIKLSYRGLLSRKSNPKVFAKTNMFLCKLTTEYRIPSKGSSVKETQI